MDAEDSVKKDLWKMIKAHIPTPVILLISFYIAIGVGGLKVYNVLTANEKLAKEYIQSLTSIYVLVFVILTIFEVIVCSILFIRNKGKIVKQEEVPKGKIDAFIVGQDEPSRDSKFNDINQNVKKTYWVLGVSLTSVVDHEKTLEKMADDKIDIKLCMMNPDIAVDNLCRSSVENNACVLNNLLHDIKKGIVQFDHIQENATGIDNCGNLLEIYHVLINVIHFNEYYVTVTDYKDRIKSSYNSLKLIRNNIINKYGQDSLALKVADSFIPMSLTIADAYETDGRMVVEFHLPFTQYKVLFEINKINNKELFEVFIDFYNIVWNRAQSNE